MTTPLLSFRGVSKRFGDTVVVDRVSFDVGAGRIVALLGQNGAGKSTLIKMLAGVYPRDAGEILHRGQDVDRPDGRSNLAFIHQDLGLIEWMTVAENMALGYGYQRDRGLIRWRAVRERARQALELVGGGIDPRTRVFDLPRTEKSLVAIARALVLDADVLVLDEPTASLPKDDVGRLFSVLDDLRRRGVGMIYVTHRLDEVFELADDVVVMRNGRLVASTPVAQTSETAVVGQIVGGAVAQVSAAAPPADGPVALQLADVVVADVGPCSLAIHAGEIVGLAGLRSAGQELVGRALCGIARIDGGAIALAGARFAPSSPGDAVRRGVAFVTGNRESEGAAHGLSVRENVFLNPGAQGRRLHHLLGRRAEQRAAAEVVRRYGVQPADPERAVDTLSGGNQQKVILARWLDTGSAVLVLEEPTMGVDVGAKAEIYKLMAEAARSGAAVIVVSSDFHEVAMVCTRAVVFNRGRVVDSLQGERLSAHALVDAASRAQVGRVVA